MQPIPPKPCRIRLPGLPPYNLDLGCKKRNLKGWIGLDIVDFGQDLLWDVREGIPLPDNSVDQIRAIHFLEHIEEDYQWQLWEHIRRVCCHGARIETITPYAGTPESWDIAHNSQWDEVRIHGLSRCWGGGFRVLRCRRQGVVLEADLQVLKR